MKNKRLAAAIIALAAATLILGYLNMKGMDASDKAAGSITFIYGEKTVKLSYEEITSLDSQEFKATEDTSGSGPSSRKYKGVLLRDVLYKASIDRQDIEAASKVTVKGLDGYVIALGADEVLADKGVHLAYEKDGKPLGNMSNGGSGPVQLIAKTDTFSQRWCKYVCEVKLE
ncbi:MAG TPA: molybdopterin-dependent oxidoreductase [Negativicutes bacterium]|nr:molybdopterin-dependent oxidoreductase [Negativicutes bacterium]